MASKEDVAKAMTDSLMYKVFPTPFSKLTEKQEPKAA